MILIIDNYDSFVHNVARYFDGLGAQTQVVRNDRIDLPAIQAMRPDAIVISPGPCTPVEAGVSLDVVTHLSGSVPILGVCLGHQCLGAVHGGRIGRAKRPLHGQASSINHEGRRLFADLPNPVPMGRYHSLIVEETPALTQSLTIDAVSDDGEIMALSHRTHPTYGVQFHPESVLSPQGRTVFDNFLHLARAWERHVLA